MANLAASRAPWRRRPAILHTTKLRDIPNLLQGGPPMLDQKFY